MGFRFSIKDANTVALLTCGRIFPCYDSIFYSHDNYRGFMDFLNRFPENIFSKDQNNMENYYQEIRGIQNVLSEIEIEKYLYMQKKGDFEATGRIRRNEKILYSLSVLSEILDSYRVKSLWLPQVNCGKDEIYEDYMTSEETLRKMLNRYPYAKYPDSSYLILQPSERPHSKRLTIFNSFPNFDVALRQINRWPAVLFWDGKNRNNLVFVPISYRDELDDLYQIIQYEKNCFKELQRYAEQKKESSHYYIHLSDLHFGNKNVEVKRRRLKNLIEDQLTSMEPDDDIGFIVTGDVVDSPSKGKSIADDFSEFLESKNSKDELITVLGNHDINSYGLNFPFFRRKQLLAHSVGQYPKIIPDEKIKVLFLLFNSNTNGDWATGEIGNAQMSEMGNKLKKYKPLGDYTLIAVLHHHVVPIPPPNFYNENWFKKHVANENTLRLKDADLFFEWLTKRNVRIVLHGHNHILFNTEESGIHIISCGSSTGHITHKDQRKTYMTYNLLNFGKRSLTCVQCAEEVLGAGLNEIKDTDTVTIDY